MSIKKSLTLIIITLILSFSVISVNEYKSFAVGDITQPKPSTNSVEVNADGNNINININTDGIKEDLAELGDKAKEQYDKLNEQGFFTKIADWFESFINSIIDLFKGLMESFK